MDQTIELVDHTLGWLAAGRAEGRDFTPLLSGIEKYPVVLLEIPSGGGNPEKLAGGRRPVRVEFSPGTEELARAVSSGCGLAALSWRHGMKELRVLQDAVLDAAQAFPGVYLKLRNASELEEKVLFQYLDFVGEYGLSGLIYCDEGSVLDPVGAHGKLLRVRTRASCRMEFCAGNRYGLATATTFAALGAGICTVHTSVGGVVPAGGAAMEETLMCAKHFLNIRNAPDTTSLAGDCASLLRAGDMEVPLNKAIIGQDIFAHESGIHVDGVIKNPGLYEAIEPREVGLMRRLVVGKHSGKSAVRMKLMEMGIYASDELTEQLIRRVKKLAEDQKHALADFQLEGLYDDYVHRQGA